MPRKSIVITDINNLPEHLHNDKPCRSCGSTVRYKSDNRCFPCKQEINKRRYK